MHLRFILRMDFLTIFQMLIFKLNEYLNRIEHFKRKLIDFFYFIYTKIILFNHIIH